MNITCRTPSSCSETPHSMTWTGPSELPLVPTHQDTGGTMYSSEHGLRPGFGDDGRDLVCCVSYTGVKRIMTQASTQLQIVCESPSPPSAARCLAPCSHTRTPIPSELEGTQVSRFSA